MSELKRLDFAKESQQYSFYYDNVRELINHLVDIADSSDCNLDLMDIFTVVNRLAQSQNTVNQTGEV